MKMTRVFVSLAVSAVLMLSLSAHADVVIVSGGYVSGHDLVLKMDVPVLDMRLLAVPTDQYIPGAITTLEKDVAVIPGTCSVCPGASPLQPSENHLAYMRIGWRAPRAS